MVIPLMTGVTIVFVVGYSWLDTHLAVTVNSGVGAGLAWKVRLLPPFLLSILIRLRG